MKLGSRFSTAIAALLCMISASRLPAGAQSIDPPLESIRTAIIRTIGVQNETVDLKITGKIFLVSRVNSNLNQANHTARDGEASRIATVVAKALADNGRYKNIHTIRVLYVATITRGGHEKLVDSIDFRKDPSGVFLFHTT